MGPEGLIGSHNGAVRARPRYRECMHATASADWSMGCRGREAARRVFAALRVVVAAILSVMPVRAFMPAMSFTVAVAIVVVAAMGTATTASADRKSVV